MSVGSAHVNLESNASNTVMLYILFTQFAWMINHNIDTLTLFFRHLCVSDFPTFLRLIRLFYQFVYVLYDRVRIKRIWRRWWTTSTLRVTTRARPVYTYRYQSSKFRQKIACSRTHRHNENCLQYCSTDRADRTRPARIRRYLKHKHVNIIINYSTVWNSSPSFAYVFFARLWWRLRVVCRETSQSNLYWPTYVLCDIDYYCQIL